MRPIAPGERLVIASHNPGKLAEIDALLAPYGVAAVGAAALGLPEPEETGATFEDNAVLKARAAAEASGMAALADDSGLVVPALGLDLVRERLEGRVRDLWLAPILALVFVTLFVAVEWPFASFLITQHSRNWFFNGANYVYFMTHQFASRTFSFADWDPWARPLAPQLALALVLATVTSYVGLKWGTWMTKVRR